MGANVSGERIYTSNHAGLLRKEYNKKKPVHQYFPGQLHQYFILTTFSNTYLTQEGKISKLGAYLCTLFQLTMPGLIMSYNWKITRPSARSEYSQFTYGSTPIEFIQFLYAAREQKQL
jgi:hypothetical protein